MGNAMDARREALLAVCMVLAFLSRLAGEEEPRFEFLGAGLFALPDATVAPDGIDVADVNGDGTPDAVASFGGDAPVLRSYLAEAPLRFHAGSDTPSSKAGRVLLEDLNGDGDVEAMVQVPGYEGFILIFGGNGDGSFGPPTPTQVRSEPWAQFLFTDFDDDGNKDMLVAGPGAFVSFGPDFTDARNVGEYNESYSGLAAMDCDLDGRTDIVLSVIDAPARFRLLRQLSNRQLFGYSVTGDGIGPLFNADTNGDGLVEVVAMRRPSFASFRFERAADGWTTQARSLGTVPPPDPFYKAHVLADLDRDGLDDMFAIGEDGFGRVLWGERSLDGLVFEQDRRVFPLPAVPGRALEAQDIDGDGLRDIVLAATHYQGGAYLLTRPGRTFVSGTRISTTARERAAAVFDIDLDGFDELATIADGRFIIHRGRYDGFLPRLDVSGAGPGAFLAGGRLFAGDAVEIYMGGTGPSLRRLEIDPEGNISPWVDSGLSGYRYTDLHMIRNEPFAADRLLAVVTLVDGGAAISEHFGASPGVISERWRVLVPSNSSTPRLADLDGDPHEDLVFATEGGATVLRGSPGGLRPYTEAASVPWSNVQSIAAIDIERDGAWEAAVARSSGEPAGLLILKRSSDGSWSHQELSKETTPAVLPFDVDGDGFTDLAALGYGLDVFHNDGRGGFEKSPERIPTRGDHLRAGDVDGDGSVDLTALSYNGIHQSFGTGDGAIEGSRTLAVGRTYILKLVPLDANGDGVEDILVVREFGVNDMLIGLASGGFASPAALEGDAGLAELFAVGDLDDDGHLDLAWTQGFIRGQGDGTFAKASQSLNLSPSTFSFSAGDINEDGATDLLVHQFQAAVRWLPGGPDFVTASAATVDPGLDVEQATLADLDGDSHLDVVLRAGMERYHVLPGSGAGSFGARIGLPRLVSRLVELQQTLADLNGDGFPDTLSPTREGLFPQLGRGDFTFDVADRISSVVRLSEDSTLAFEDLDGDGQVEIIGGEFDFFVARGLGGGAFEPAVLFDGSFSGLLDVNRDGLPDILTTSYEEYLEERIDAILASPLGLLRAPRLTPSSQSEDLALGDLDGDPQAEIVVSASGAFVRVFDGQGRNLRLAAELTVAGDREFIPVEVHDLDRDGLDDIALLRNGRLLWRRNAGQFSFDPEATLAEGVPLGDFAFTDLDGDGTVDVLASGFVFLRGIGPAAFEAPRDHRFGASMTLSAALDFNDDGILDVAQTGGTGNRVFFSAGTGSGSFEAAQFLSLADRYTYLGGLATGDFDGDGLTDVAMAEGGRDVTSPPEVWYSTPGGLLRRGQDLLDTVFRANGSAGLEAVDLNGDEVDDLLASDHDGYVLAYLGGPEGLSTPFSATHRSMEPGLLVVGNFVGDGAPDLVTGGDDGLVLTQGLRTGLSFSRGDTNADGALDISDPISVLNWLFAGEGAPMPCDDAADSNDDGAVDLSDAVNTLRHLFGPLAELPQPFGGCGPDPTLDDLSCAGAPECL